ALTCRDLSKNLVVLLWSRRQQLAQDRSLFNAATHYFDFRLLIELRVADAFGDSGLLFAERLSNRLIARVRLRFEKREIPFAFFNRSQIPRVGFFGPGDPMEGFVARFDPSCRNPPGPRHFRCSKTALTGDDLIAIAVLHHENRLEHAMFLDRMG